jgi:(2Fe-2S) ferredoxin
VVCQDCLGGGAVAEQLRCSALPVRTSSCLDRCDYADVVVVRPSPEGRRRGGRPVWFGFTDAYAAERVAGWVDAGGPGIADIPEDLDLHRVERPRVSVRAAGPPNG